MTGKAIANQRLQRLAVEALEEKKSETYELEKAILLFGSPQDK
jgi:hypothetical protein